MPMPTKEQQREYQRLWVAKRRSDFFSDKTCVKCNSSERLELDHIDPSKKVSHSIWSWSESRRLEEIAKCQVLCRPCHWEKTKIDLNYGLKHGTLHGHKRYKCRCEECKEVHRQHWRNYRLSKKK